MEFSVKYLIDNSLLDPYVKIYLLYNDQRIAKKKTHVKKRTLNPVFNESFVFELPHLEEGLKHISLEFMLLDWDRVTKNEVIVSPIMANLEMAKKKSFINDITLLFSVLMGGRLLVDIKGEFSWTMGEFSWTFCPREVLFLGEFLWTFFG